MADLDVRYSYKHAPTIERFSNSRKFIRGLMGPFGSGKSSGCAVEIPQWAARQHLVNGKRRSRFAVVRNTYPQLSDTTIKTWLGWFPEPAFGKYNKTDHTYLLQIDDIESEILFRALDRPEHVANLLSLELTGAWLNEAREIPFEIFNTLKGRVDRYPKRDDGGSVDPGIIIDTNPPADDHWIYRVFEEEKPENCELFKQPSARSPEAENLPNLSPSYYSNLMEGASEDYIRVYVDGQYGYVKDGKPVYPEYRDETHCKEAEPVKGVKILRGWDSSGLTPACVFTQLLPDGRWLILEELCGEYVGAHEFADIVIELSSRLFPGYKFEDYGDPAGAQRSPTSMDRAEKTYFDILRGKGIDIQPAEQNLTIRLESVRLALNTLRNGVPRFQISPRCTMLRKGLMGRYQYKRFKITGANERYKDEPDKNEYSHPHDALQYVATHIFGDLVRGRDERRRDWNKPLEELYPDYFKQLRRGIA